MSKYAEGTSVPVQRSLVELQGLVERFGAEQFGYSMDSRGRATFTFATAERVYRFEVLPSDPDAHRNTPTGRRRDGATAQKLAVEETARRWRSLVLLVKALLVAVEDGLMDTPTALLPWTVLPDGQTLAAWAEPRVAVAYERGSMPAIEGGPR